MCSPTPDKVSASSVRALMPRELPRCAAWSRRSGTTAHSLRRNLPLGLSPPTSIELGVLVDHIGAHLDADRRELQDGIPLDDLINPPLARARAEIDQAQGKPRSIKMREWRPSPAAKSRTRPPGLISGINRSTQAEVA